MGIADMVNRVAVEIHVAAACGIFDPDTFGLDDGGNTRTGQALMQERFGVTLQQIAGCGIGVLGGPGAPRG